MTFQRKARCIFYRYYSAMRVREWRCRASAVAGPHHSHREDARILKNQHDVAFLMACEGGPSEVASGHVDQHYKVLVRFSERKRSKVNGTIATGECGKITCPCRIPQRRGWYCPTRGRF